MIGVLGGMGPAATVDFMAKLIRLSPVGREQDHLPVVVVSDPRVPDRVAPILEGRGDSPLAGHARRHPARSSGPGRSCVAIPCHTAHAWYEQLAAGTELPILHIVDGALAELERLAVPAGPLGLLATAATLEAGLYQERLAAAGHPALAARARGHGRERAAGDRAGQARPRRGGGTAARAAPSSI